MRPAGRKPSIGSMLRGGVVGAFGWRQVAFEQALGLAPEVTFSLHLQPKCKVLALTA
jgi:hypothetical protein